MVFCYISRMKKTITILLAVIGIMSCGNTPKQAENLKDKAWQEIAPPRSN